MKFVMKCCGKVNPIGTDRENLWLSFEKDGNREILSYKVNIASSAEYLEAGKCDVAEFQYKGSDGYIIRPDKTFFKERTRYYWSITAETDQGICVS